MPRTVPGHAAFTRPPSGTVVAIGNFDGVHLGHRAVLARLRDLAERLRVPGAVYTFDPAPTAVVAPARHQPRICTLPERIRRLGEEGVDIVVVEPFTPAFAAGTAEWFARVVLGERLGARGLVVGHDFRFGAGREGDLPSLRAWLPDLAIVEVDAVELDGIVSSSRVRKLVLAGDVETAGRLLGRPVMVSGAVQNGAARGRTIGFPTANVRPEEECLPGPGVYAVRVELPGGAERGGVCNVGVRPTFGGGAVSIEAHLFDFEGNLYGATLRVHFVARLREERRFESVDALVAQIRLDAAAARARLA